MGSSDLSLQDYEVPVSNISNKLISDFGSGMKATAELPSRAEKAKTDIVFS